MGPARTPKPSGPPQDDACCQDTSENQSHNIIPQSLRRATVIALKALRRLGGDRSYPNGDPGDKGVGEDYDNSSEPRRRAGGRQGLSLLD
ncbi:MAG TPA: hypothetical protein VGC48_00780, partial [Gemmatimonadales bacterium]